nr:STAS domain-containing protein [Antrihabitans stalagmiti]
MIEALREAAENADRALVVDLTPVTFLASAGMSALVFACGLTRSRGVGFAVAAAGPVTARPLTLMELTGTLAVVSSLDEALAAVSR